MRTSGLLTERQILEIQATIEGNSAGYRKVPGTALKNDATGEVIYTPPQSYEEIKPLMANLEKFINDESLCDWDSLTKMAIIHHQFESIHPFYDGNGCVSKIGQIYAGWENMDREVAFSIHVTQKIIW